MRVPDPASDVLAVASKRGLSADWGRLAAMPLLAMAAYLSTASLFSFGWRHDHPVASGLALASRLATIAFYCLIVFAYLRRRPPLATSASSTAFAAAMAATFLPFAFTFLGYHTTGIYPLLVVDVLLIAGTGFATWGVRHLDRSSASCPRHGPSSPRAPTDGFAIPCMPVSCWRPPASPCSSARCGASWCGWLCSPCSSTGPTRRSSC